MPVEMGMWRIDGDAPRRLGTSTLPSEATLEEFLERDHSLLGERLLVIGRQVRTPYGKYIDLLAVDADGNLNVLELKREKTPREVVAQTLDYGSWVSTLTRDEVLDIANAHLGQPFESAFEETFGGTPPDELNADLRLTIVATELDSSSERIVTYLRSFGVPINAVFFSFLEDEGRRYLARSWFATVEDDAGPTVGPRRSGKRAEWNQRDWFISFGDEVGGRSWADGLKYGFVSAGGDPWYSRTLRTVPEGARVNVHIPKRGYVAVGVTLGEARRFDDARVAVAERMVPLAEQALVGSYQHASSPELEHEDVAEWVIPVRWIDAVSADHAYWEKGMFANQNSACKLRQEFTLDRLATHFRLEDSG